jgi:type I restriction enzyme R subunit
VPNDAALKIRDAVGFFQEIRAVLAKSISEGGGKSPEELELAVRQIVSRAISSDKVIGIFDAAGLKKPDISILSDEFLAEEVSDTSGTFLTEPLEGLVDARD